MTFSSIDMVIHILPGNSFKMKIIWFYQPFYNYKPQLRKKNMENVIA